jgi:D-sedoheptulose 7-phosphate isomerase
MDFTENINEYFDRLKETIDKFYRRYKFTYEHLVKGKEEERNVFVMGNGGSGATASHMCCDFKQRYLMERKKCSDLSA